MNGLLEALQIIGSVLSTKMSGQSAKQVRLVLLALVGLSLLGFLMQTEGARP